MSIKVTPRLGSILKEKGWTQMMLSKYTGIPQPTISNFDRSKQHQDVHLFTIANVFGLKIEDLFYVEDIVSDDSLDKREATASNTINLEPKKD